MRDYIDRFSIPEPNSGCWLWLKGCTLEGYGVAWRAGSRMPAHRASWIAYYGPIPAGLCVCHKCDVPSCVNPHHLFLGTNLDNIADSVMKGRRCHGPKHHKTKLTADLVREIRRRWMAGEGTQSGMAREYGVRQNAVREIVIGNVWRSA